MPQNEYSNELTSANYRFPLQPNRLLSPLNEENAVHMEHIGNEIVKGLDLYGYENVSFVVVFCHVRILYDVVT
jgi:hypothetical protein